MPNFLYLCDGNYNGNYIINLGGVHIYRIGTISPGMF